MATRGITQLQRLKLKYCEVGGSSRSMREFIQNHLVEWANAHPETQIEVLRRNNRHPNVEAVYLTKDDRRGQGIHQVSVKNTTVEDVVKACDMLANRSGRKITKITKPVLTDTPSVQGIWTPHLNLQHEPAFSVKMQHPPRTDTDDSPSVNSTSQPS